MTSPGIDLVERGNYDRAVLAYVDDDGYPMEVATTFRAEEGEFILDTPAGDITPPNGSLVDLLFSHINPVAGYGYDQRRYVSVWGPVRHGEGTLVVTPERAKGWDENDVPFFEYSERSVPQAHRYFRDLGRLQGREVRPKLAGFWLFLRATRLPFLTATFVPVALGVAAAGSNDTFDLWLALLTLLGAVFIHLALNVTNDVFDTLSGADAANSTPTPFSGGSRVIHYGLVSLRTMSLMAGAFYLAGGAIGVYLAATRGWELLIIGAVGLFFAVFYTAPPFKLVYRGLGEIAVAIGFGPAMLLGAYFVQAQEITAEAWVLSIPVAIFIALVLYANEIPDRPGDAAAGKRTLPVRWSKEAVITGYRVAAGIAFATIAVGAVTGMLPRPTIIALATIPLALQCARQLGTYYEQPYALMPALQTNIRLHLFTGLLLLAGYLVAIVAGALMENPPFFLV